MLENKNTILEIKNAFEEQLVNNMTEERISEVENISIEIFPN